MAQNRNVVLTGFMGTGKTTVGKLVAKKLGYEFVDTDAEISARNHCTIAAIFEQQGEAAFRDMEAELARELSEKNGLVISTGGRMMLDPANKAVLETTGTVFCLWADPRVILERVAGDAGAVRPLLSGDDAWEKVTALLAERAEGYGQYEQVDTTDCSPDAVAAKIISIFQETN